MDIMKSIESDQIKENNENFNIGDTIKIYFKIIEGKTERIQVYEGLALSLNNSGVARTVTVRTLSHGVGVERIFPLNSPKIEKIEISRHGKVRRAKLYYIRERVGKSAKVKELIRKKTDKKIATK
jgi:large subunit ribosomal protein L19